MTSRNRVAGIVTLSGIALAIECATVAAFAPAIAHHLRSGRTGEWITATRVTGRVLARLAFHPGSVRLGATEAVAAGVPHVRACTRTRIESGDCGMASASGTCAGASSACDEKIAPTAPVHAPAAASSPRPVEATAHVTTVDPKTPAETESRGLSPLVRLSLDPS